MRIHHLNCGSFCPFGGHYMDRITSGLGTAHMVCHCLLVETHGGLVLIDTGFGMRDIYKPKKRSSPYLRALVRPKFDVEETAVKQIRRLGFHPSDVRHIVLTHLDFDHAGGLDDFHHAEVHVMETELEAALNPKGFISTNRYQPDQLAHTKTWNTYQPQGEKWFGFEAVKQLKSLPPEILMVPLYGHTEGHAGIAVNTDQGWLLHAGDAYFFRGELNTDYSCPLGLRAYQRLMDTHHKLRQQNQMLLRDLAHTHHHDVRIFSAHDAVEFVDLINEEPRLLAGTSENFENVIWMRRNLQQPKTTGSSFR